MNPYNNVCVQCFHNVRVFQMWYLHYCTCVILTNTPLIIITVITVYMCICIFNGYFRHFNKLGKASHLQSVYSNCVKTTRTELQDVSELTESRLQLALKKGLLLCRFYRRQSSLPEPVHAAKRLKIHGLRRKTCTTSLLLQLVSFKYMVRFWCIISECSSLCQGRDWNLSWNERWSPVRPYLTNDYLITGWFFKQFAPHLWTKKCSCHLLTPVRSFCTGFA